MSLKSSGKPIRVQVLSDLHAERDLAAAPSAVDVATGADIVVVAGDVARAPDSVAIAAEMFPDAEALVLVGGNHEHYLTSLTIDEGMAAMVRAADGHSSMQCRTVAALENGEIVVEVRGTPVRILGCTLWTDYALFGDPVKDRLIVSQGLNDYRAIKAAAQNPMESFLGVGHRAVSTSELLSRHDASVAFLEAALARPHDGPTIVVTHHLPSLRSVSQQYKRDRTSAGFASNLDRLVAKGATLWVHGHTHSPCLWRERTGGTLVACNPMGYSRRTMSGRWLENAKFDPKLVVDIRRGAPDGAWRAGRERRKKVVTAA